MRKWVVLKLGFLVVGTVWMTGCLTSGENNDQDNSEKLLSEVTKSEDFGSIEFGAFIIENNVWGKQNIVGYSQSVFLKRYNTRNEIGWTWAWPLSDNPHSVKAYPEIIFGHKPWSSTSTTSVLPVKLNKIHSIPVETHLTTHSLNGSGNLAFDCWITHNDPPTPDSIHTELMIWYTYETLQPAGSKIDQVLIDGKWFDLYLAQMDWQYVAYKYQGDTLINQIDINHFIDDLINRELLVDSDYLATIEFGNEVVQGFGQTVIEDYKITVNLN